jgi:Na+-driven multidrug efflux pump
MKIDKLSLLKYTLPLILSGLAEQLLLLTDVFLISFKGQTFLATIGLIDAFLLCSLSYGFALNDTFQNFYSRNIDKSTLTKSVFQKSIIEFLKYAVIVSTLFSIIAHCVSIVFRNDIYQLFLENIPILIPLIILNYISMSINAFLLGFGKTKSIGIISFVCIVINALLGYVFLFKINLQISPLAIILYSSIIAEAIGIIMMWKVIRRSSPKIFNTEPIKQKILITMIEASYYPALSDLSFHIGSFILFLFCSKYFELSEVALLTMILSYWGVLLVPTEAFSETALNYFSSIYSKKRFELYKALKDNIIKTSLAVSVGVFLILVILEYILYGIDIDKLLLLTLVLIIVFITNFNDIFSISLIVRLKNNLFATSKAIYGIIAIISIFTVTYLWCYGIISILLSLLFAQIAMYLFLKTQSNKIWKNSTK